MSIVDLVDGLSDDSQASGKDDHTEDAVFEECIRGKYSRKRQYIKLFDEDEGDIDGQKKRKEYDSIEYENRGKEAEGFSFLGLDKVLPVKDPMLQSAKTPEVGSDISDDEKRERHDKPYEKCTKESLLDGEDHEDDEDSI